MTQQRIIWFALVASTVMYAVIVYTLAPVPPRPFEESVRSTFTLAMYALAFMEFIAALILPGRLPQADSRKKMIVAMAMFESCAIFGLVAAFVQHDWRVYVPAWIAALIGFVREWPREEVTSPLL
jgi:MFS family permease